MSKGPLAIFAYGSLVDPASAELTLGRPVATPSPVRLGGWKRRWSIARDNHRFEKTFAVPGGTVPGWILGLNIEPGAGLTGSDRPNGALIEVSPIELDLLDRREMRYHRVEVTDQIEEAQRFGVIYAFTARAEHLRVTPPRDSVILRAYADAVEAAFENLGPGQLDAFRLTTPQPSVSIVEADLVRDQIPEGNPRAW